MQFHVALWDDDDFELIELEDFLSSEEKVVDAAVVISRGTAIATVQRAQQHMSTVRCLQLAYSFDPLRQTVLELLQKADFSHLSVLWLRSEIQSSQVDLLADALSRMPQLQQLSMSVSLSCTDDVAKALFDSMRLLRLSALKFECQNDLPASLSDRFCDVLREYQDVLVSLDLNCTGLNFWTAFCKSLRAPKLRYLRLNHYFEAPRAVELCKALEMMPRLQTLRLCMVQSAIPVLESFFRASFRPVTSLAVRLSTTNDALIIALFQALKQNTRLHTLRLAQSRFFNVLHETCSTKGT